MSTLRGRVAVRKIRLVLDVAAGAGAPLSEVLARSGLSAEDVADPDAFLPQERWRDVWLAAVDVTRNPHLGLHAGMRIDRGYFGVIDYIVRSSATMGDAIAAASRFFRLANTEGRVTAERDGDLVRVERTIGGDEALLLPRQAAEFSLVVMRELFRHAARDPWTLVRADFRAPPTDDAEHRRILGCPIRFGAPADALWLHRDALAIPMRSPDPRLRTLIERHGEELLAALPSTDDVIADVRRELARLLTGGEPTIDAVATRLGASRRTLQRRLGDRDTTFAAVLAEMRRDLATRYLDAGMSIGEVAYLLGYSETSAFHRAWRAWTGGTPGRRGASGQEIGAIGQ